MNFENVPDSLKKRAEACKTPEELLALAAEEGYELTDEELKAINIVYNAFRSDWNYTIFPR